MVNTQAVGAVLVGVAGWLLWSAWALAIVGVLLIVLPEVAAAVRVRRQRKAAERRSSTGRVAP